MAKPALFMSICLVLSTACSLFSSPVAHSRIAVESATGPAASTAKNPATSTSDASLLPTVTAVSSVEIKDARVNYYRVFGSSVSELRSQLVAKGPVGYDGYRGDATTKWSIRWDWPGYGSNTCDLTQATISYEIVVDFPRWNPPDEVSPGLVAEWNRFVLGLAKHEQNHVDFVVENYQSVVDAIGNATCTTADAAAASALELIRQLDRDYDARTNHGEAEGVRLR